MKTRNSQKKSIQNKKSTTEQNPESRESGSNGFTEKVKLTYFQLYLQRETPEKRARRLLKQKIDKKERRELETEEERLVRLKEEAAYMKRRRHNETPEKREKRLLQRKKHYQETRAKEEAATNTNAYPTNCNERLNLSSKDIVKEDVENKLPSNGIAKPQMSSKNIETMDAERNVHNKENRHTTDVSTRSPKRNSNGNDLLIPLTPANGTSFQFEHNSVRRSVGANENQFVKGTSNQSLSTYPISNCPPTVLKVSSMNGIGLDIKNSAFKSFLFEMAWKKYHREHPYQIHSKSGRPPSYDFSKALDIVAWRKYTNYLHKTSSNRTRL